MCTLNLVLQKLDIIQERPNAYVFSNYFNVSGEIYRTYKIWNYESCSLFDTKIWILMPKVGAKIQIYASKIEQEVVE